MNYPVNQIRFSTSSSLMITSYALISITNFLLVAQQIFSTDSRIKESSELGLFVAALALTAINCMILLYIKSRKMPKQGIRIGLFPRIKSFNFGPIIFTIFQIILMSLLIALYILSYTNVNTSTKIFTLSALIILNIGQILTVWSFSSTHCSTFNPMQQGMMQGMQNQMVGSQMGMQQPYYGPEGG
jgi:hypothetical protein